MLVSNKSLPRRSVMKSAKVSVIEELVRPLPRSFYDKGTVTVARKLLGKRLVRVRGRVELIGRIVEVEAYRGRDDPASHAYRQDAEEHANVR